jgi:hypothetical protein
MKGIDIATITSIFSAFIHGELNPLPVHVVLIGIAILAEFAVAVGIVLEAPPPEERSARENWGVRLVLGGVILSAVFTILLFVFDEGISNAQQARIIELSPRNISPEARQEIGKSCAKFSGRTVLVISQYNDPEGYALATEIEEALKISQIEIIDKRGQAGIDLTRPPSFGVIVLGPQASSPLEFCLSDALEKLAHLKPEPTGYPAHFSPPTEPVVIFVGLKPVA